MAKHGGVNVRLTEQEAVTILSALATIGAPAIVELWSALSSLTHKYPLGKSVKLGDIPMTSNSYRLSLHTKTFLEALLSRQNQQPEIWELSLAALRRMK